MIGCVDTALAIFLDSAFLFPELLEEDLKLKDKEVENSVSLVYECFTALSTPSQCKVPSS